MPRSLRLLVSLLVSGLALLVVAPTALAGVITREGNVLRFTANAGETNQVVIGFDAGTSSVLFTDRNPIVAAGCTPTSVSTTQTTVRCPASAQDELVVELANLNDSVRFDASFGMTGTPAVVTLDGGDGDDSLQSPTLAVTSDTLLGGPGEDDLQAGPGNDTLDGGAGPDDMAGGGGTDTLSYADRTNRVAVTLDGVNNDGEGCPPVGSSCENDRAGTDIENVEGGEAGDRLEGSDEVNTLSGNEGDDVLVGRLGNDVLEGDAGADTVSYEDRTAPVTADLGAGNGGQEGERDTYSSIANLTGGAADDRLIGSASSVTSSGANRLEGLGGNDALEGLSGNDVLRGGEGTDLLVGGSENDDLDGQGGDNDILRGGGGADQLKGGAGAGDTADYSDRTGPLTITLDGQANDGTQASNGPPPVAAEGDNAGADGTVEDVTGGTGNDVITGDDAPNVLFGGDGSDTLNGRLAGDRLDGGGGTDRVSYAGRTADVAVTLEDASASDGQSGEGDVVLNMENATGGAGNDTLTGTGGANSILGGDGDDMLDGLAGADSLEGQGGARDRTVYSGDRATGVTVTLDDAANDGDTTDGNADNVRTEDVFATAGPDTITGNAVDNRIVTFGGDDVLNGDLGNDLLEGGDGTDRLSGSTGSDTLDGGTGTDVINGAAGTDTVSYAGRTGRVVVTLGDNAANDGEGGENDGLVSIENATGGSGGDELVGDSTSNRLEGGPGDDLLDGGPGVVADTFVGDAGSDTVTYRGRSEALSLTLDGEANDGAVGANADDPGERDSIEGTVENVTAGLGNDTIVGDGVANALRGEEGDDTINARDGVADRVECGPGTDTVSADSLDTVAGDCERVERAGPVGRISVADATVVEGDSGTKQITFRVSLEQAVGFQVSAQYTTVDGSANAGEDYVAETGTITFAPNERVKDVDVTVNGDTTIESSEAFNLRLSNPLPQPGSELSDATATGTIADDDDMPTVSVSDAGTVTEGNTGTTPARFAVTLSDASRREVRVRFATQDGTATAREDYAARAETLTFAPGETSKTVEVAVTSDTADEPDEAFTGVLSEPVNATVADGSGTARITDDDEPPAPAPTPVAPPSLSVADVEVNEGDSGTVAVTVPVTVSRAAGSAMTVRFATQDGTAKAGSDYTAASGTLTFAPGETTKNVSVPIRGDETDEPDESFAVVLSQPAGATLGRSTGTVSVIDDEVTRVKPRVSYSLKPTSDRRTPFRFVVSGRLVLPSGTTAEEACGSGTVSAQYKNGRKTISTRRGKVSSSCRFKITTTFTERSRLPKSGRLKLTVRFQGNKALLPVKRKSRRVRAG